MAEAGSAVGRKREASRRTILDATAEIVAEKGVERLTISEVAKRAGVNRALVYHYFGNRDKLVEQAINHIVDRYEPFPPGATIGATAVERAVRLQVEHPLLPRFFFQSVLQQRPLPRDLLRIQRAVETLEQMNAQGAGAAPDATFALTIFTLVVLAWALARNDIARMLSLSVSEADTRLIRQLQHLVELELHWLPGRGGGERRLAAT